jgi:hypothetical protein
MKNTKWFAMLAAVGLALTVSACGDDEEGRPCEVNDDCLDTEICDTDCNGGVCITPCTGNGDCSEGDVCLDATDTCAQRCGPPPGAACTEDADCNQNACETCDQLAGECISLCDETETCDGAGNCVAATCTEQAECYPDSYCDEGGTDMCVDIATVAACDAAHGRTSVPANGPMLWGMAQSDFGAEGQCSASGPQGCTNWCAFTIFVHAPTPLPTTKAALYKRVAYSTASGSWGPAGDVEPVDGERFQVYGCFAGSSLNGAVVIVDDSTAASPTPQSNAICLSGTSDKT